MSGETIRASVAIIGGGFSGAAVAWHLRRLRPDVGPIVVIEPRAELGRGLAYSAGDPTHRINVPAVRMSLVPDEPGHFNDWLEASGRLVGDPAARRAGGANFPSRAVFGAYVAEHLGRISEAATHVRATALHVERVGEGYAIATDDGRTVLAPLLVLAVCHPSPNVPAGFSEALVGHPRVIANPWTEGASDAIGADHRVLIVGTGLTMADIVATLDRRGHGGPVVAVSRRGLRSRGHSPVPLEPYGDFATVPASTARELVRNVRRTLAAAARDGIGWQAVFDQLKLQGGAIWAALPFNERRRLLRHLRPFWDVHRFRIAPQVEEVLERRIAEGSLLLRRASLRGVARDGEEIVVTFRDRRSGAVEEARFDALILATGPAHGRVFADNPLLGALEAEGLAHPDALGLGIEVDLAGRAIDAQGRAQSNIFVAGPLARGTFGELMGLPEVALHAVRVASGVAARLDAASSEAAA